MSSADLQWVDQALCAQVDPDLFFPGKGGSTIEARKVCRMCDVISECLEYAMKQPGIGGILADTSERQRSKLREERDADSGE